MRRSIAAAVLVGAGVLGTAVAMADGFRNGDDRDRVLIRDECDPTDPAWDPTGGCHQRHGDVTFKEFIELLFTSLSAGSVIGHPAWVMDPTYTKLGTNEDLKVKNVGGRTHTFTEVADFGGGFVPDLNGVLIEAPECEQAAPIAPGDRVKIENLSVGEHYFQCCIHPWMRIVVNVERHDEDD